MRFRTALGLAALTTVTGMYREKKPLWRRVVGFLGWTVVFAMVLLVGIWGISTLLNCTVTAPHR
jgi:uncharacterized membrane protein YdcZ (DUF606 family)